MNLTVLISNATVYNSTSPLANITLAAVANRSTANDSGSIILQQLGELDTTQLLTTVEVVSDKPCGEAALSSQTPSTVKLPGSLDALLYIVIVLMFYAFSIVILMVKYIRREREDASLRNYYHEFVSRDKFRSAQYKNNHFMKRMFARNCDEDTDPEPSIDSEPPSPWTLRKKTSQPQTKIKNGNTFSKLRLECDDDDAFSRDKRFTFLGAKSHFCRSSHVGKGFCNKQLCSKCISENAPTIDWDDETESVQAKNSLDVIEVKLHPSVETRSPLRTRLLGYENSAHHDRYNARMSALDNLFFPILECDSEHDTGPKPDIVVTNGCNIDEPYRKLSNIPRESSLDDQVIVSSCSLEVSELLANMPPLGISKSFSNDMDTLDGLSNLESETENQSLLNYSSSIWHHNEFEDRAPGHKDESGKMLSVHGTTDKSEKLSDRSSLLSCSLSFDDGGKSLPSLPFTSINLSSTEHINVNNNGLNRDVLKENHKVSLSSSFSFSEKDRDKEMVRLLNDINLLADESGVFKNLKYFLRGFYKSDTEDVTETSNLLPKETYFGPGSPKSTKGKPPSPLKRSNGDILSIPSMEECLYSDDVVNSLGSHWAYAYDVEDGPPVSETERSSSFGDYCMGDTVESYAVDMRTSSKPATDSREVLARKCTGLHNSCFSVDPILPRKANPMVAGYGPARKETKV